MHLGVPFIAPMQLGSVWTPFGRLWLPSVRGLTGQSGAPPNSARFPSFSGEDDRCTHPPPPPPWHTGQSGATFWPLDEPHVTHWSRGRPLAGTRLAHRTVRYTPYSPVNYSRGALSIFPRAACSLVRQPRHWTLTGAHLTVRCTTGWCKFGLP
jgi:hypothetical protein